MCGICGYLESGKQNNPMVDSVFQSICHILSHRGPDNEGFYFGNGVGLGHARLAIIDLDTGNQPVHNEDKSVWVILNGEIYNFLKLREALISRNHVFYTHSDTEVIVHLYEEYGEECVKHLDGMFAFCIWDNNRRIAFLARDPIGKKPLYWTKVNSRVIFASELKAIYAFPGFYKEIDRESLHKYFVYGFIPSPATIFKNVNKVSPGHWLKVNKDLLTEEKAYYKLDYSDKIKEQDPQLLNGIKERFSLAVEKRLRSDVPLGVFLSGGIDSSLVALEMANCLSPSKVNAFTIGFKESAFDETEYARLVAKKIGINHNVKILSIDDACKLISKIPYFMDEPMADPSILPTYLLSAFAREHVKVALSGDGGDESFVGYPKYLAHRFLEKYKFLKKPLSGFSCLVSGKIGAFMRYASYPLYLRNQLWISLFSPQDVNSLVLGAKSKYLFEDIERYHSLFNGKDILDEALFLDQSLTLPDMYLTKVDRASMANALEVRSPFLDRALLDYTCKIPFEKKIRGGVAKFLLKAMAAEVFPSSIVNRQKKGFGIPLSQWLKHDLKALCDELFEPGKITREGLLNPEVVKNCLSFGNIHQVWSLLVFELWYEDWVRN